MLTISQWKVTKDGPKHIGNDWSEKDLEKAIESINTLKISGAGSYFVIEDEGGTVLDIVRM